MPPAVIGRLVAGPGAPLVAQVVQPAPGAPAAPAADATHRLNHMKLHITQAALAVDEVSNEDVLAMARSKGDLLEYSIGDEVHPSPADPNRPRHKHYYLKYRTPINHRDARYCQIFDMTGAGGRVLQPHIQGVGPKKEDRSCSYSQKDKLYIASPHLQNYDAEVSDQASWAVDMNKAETVQAGMGALMQRHPETFYLHASTIEHALTMRIGMSERALYSLAEFNTPRLDLSLAVVLQGASHIGKTQYALAHFEYPLLVSEIDDLKSIGLRTDGIVFDQMVFNDKQGGVNLSADSVIKLLDMECSRSIAARYRCARIPARMPRIFTTNVNIDAGGAIFARGGNRAEQEGIDSRLRVMPWLSQDMRRNPGPNARGGAARQ